MTYLRQHKNWNNASHDTPRSIKMKETHNTKIQEKKRLIAEHQANGTLTKENIHKIYYGK